MIFRILVLRKITPAKSVPEPSGTEKKGSERLFQRPGQLVGARGSAAAAVDAFEARDRLLGLHAAHEGRDALRIAVAAAREEDAADDVLVVDFDLDLPRAGSLAGIGDFPDHGMFVFHAAKIRINAGKSKKSPAQILPGPK